MVKSRTLTYLTNRISNEIQILEITLEHFHINVNDHDKDNV